MPWLHELVEEGDAETLREFFADPVNRQIVDDLDEWWRSPLELAVSQEYPSLQVIDVLLRAGAQPRCSKLESIKNIEVIALMLGHGVDASCFDRSLIEYLAGFRQVANSLGLTDAEVEAGRDVVLGRSNPEESWCPFKHVMIRRGWGGFDVSEAYAHVRSLNLFKRPKNRPIWCFARIGSSVTYLPDGRFIFIAGEHEDGYDPDFCIYNDVVVIERERSVRLFLYPQETFPPTDFHSATSVGNEIYVIGSIGYGDERRVGETPVYALSLEDYSMRQVVTVGRQPGWIARHSARRVGDKIQIEGGCVWNGRRMEPLRGVFELDLGSSTWDCVST